MSRVTLRPGRPLRGEAVVPGDKSITQRAVFLGALAPGTSRIRNGNPGRDAAAALRVVRSLGTRLRRDGDGTLLLSGGGLRESERVLDARNSGTALRLATGLLAAQPFLSVITGDRSLRGRPVDRVIVPLRALGASLSARAADRLPPVVIQGRPLRGADVDTGVASAQVKTALLFAAIQASGTSRIRERTPTRDHTERMLPHFGALVTREGSWIRVEGDAPLHGAEIHVPGDLSAAAFLAAAAAIVPGSDLLLRDVGVNPSRRAFLSLLARAGAVVSFHDERMLGAEPVADVRVRHGSLRPIEVGPEEAPDLIDELPLVSVLAAFARGESEIRGAAELRVKESDRIEAVAGALRAVGGSVEVGPDGWRIDGKGSLRGGLVEARGDHRVAMTFLVAGLRAREGVTVDDGSSLAVSDPGFLPRLRSLTR